MIYLNGLLVTGKEFPNGELNLLEIESAIKLREDSKPHHIVFKYQDDKDLMALHFIKKQLEVREPKVTVDLSIAYMPYSRMDRAETEEVPFMLQYVCDFINALKFEKVYVHEPHSIVTNLLLNCVEAIYDNVGFFEHVKNRETFLPLCDYLVFPDKGAYERYNYKGRIKENNMLYGEKKRDFGTGLIQGLELTGDTSHIIEDSSQAIIVDDLSSYGGTFVRVAQELRKLGFKRIVLLVCHAENSIFKGQLFDHVDKVYTTDSILTEHTHWENAKYKPERLTVFNLIEQLKEGNYK